MSSSALNSCTTARRLLVQPGHGQRLAHQPSDRARYPCAFRPRSRGYRCAAPPSKPHTHLARQEPASAGSCLPTKSVPAWSPAPAAIAQWFSACPAARPCSPASPIGSCPLPTLARQSSPPIARCPHVRPDGIESLLGPRSWPLPGLTGEKGQQERRSSREVDRRHDRTAVRTFT
jgi:hypothetical protein